MSSSQYESADLIMKLYEMRREAVMREARDWYIRSFNPETAQDVILVARGPHSGHYRMVSSYWDMACSFVTNGAIDAQMFNDANSEHNAVFSKLAPFVAEIREISQNPNYMKHLEQVVMAQPGAAERLEHLRAMLKSMFQSGQEEASAQKG
jgi:hypothetical protein